MKQTFLFLLILVSIWACSDDDSFTTSQTARLTFSTDTVKMDTVFSTIGTRTYDFWVFNNSQDGLRLKTVRLLSGNQSGFRVNVDGSYLDNTTGSVVNNLEIRKDDSIRVFVELTAKENLQLEAQKIEDDLVFTLESGVEQKVNLCGYAWDAVQWRDMVVSSDTLIESDKPIIIYGGITVDSLATLTFRNTTLYFHDKAGVDVYGKLLAENTVMRGDRLDHMFDYLPYDRVSGQWRGLLFHSSSYGNVIRQSEIRNAENALWCDSAGIDSDELRLYLEETVVHNSKGYGLLTVNSRISALGCQFTNALGDCVAIFGGVAVFDKCTIAQFYPFSADRGAALSWANYWQDDTQPLTLDLQITDCIVTGYADDVVMADSTGTTEEVPYKFFIKHSLLRTPAVDDTLKIVDVMWETPEDSIQGKQHFRLIDEENLIYDFRLDTLSTAHGMGCYE